MHTQHTNSTGMFIAKKQAQPLSVDMEDRLWELQLLGSSSPSVLLNTLVYMVGLYFSLRSGSEHRRLRFSPSQIELVEEPGSRYYLKYKEDVGLKSSRRKKPKEVVHFANDANPTRCFV